MSEDIRAKARRTWEVVFLACDVGALDDLVAEDLIAHGARPGEPPGIEGVRRTMLWLGRVFRSNGKSITCSGMATSSPFTRPTTRGTPAS